MKKESIQDRIERIVRMEQEMDELATVWQEQRTEFFLNADMEQKFKNLTDYMENGQWLADYEADERGELPKNLKRGVLSQDALYNLLDEIRCEKNGRNS